MTFLEVAIESMPLLLKGTILTLELTAISLVFASVVGLIVGLMRLSKNAWVRYIASSYINIIRGLPLLVQILYVYFGIPLVLGIRIPALTAGIITMSLYTGAYMAEIIRAGIESIDKGQSEAGRSLGFSQAQTLQKIVLPQAVWRMLPAFANQFTTTLKDTSLLSVIGIAELTMEGQSIYSANFQTFEVLTLVGAIYFVIVMLLVRLSNYLKVRFSR